jgi:S1-C subfamily serine protease
LQGMHIRWFGNPEGVPDIYREGVIVSVMSDGIVIDATICHGDSGAGVFDDAGELVGVVSAMTDGNGCTFMLANPEPTI